MSSLVATLAFAALAAVAAPASVAGWTDGERAAGAFTAGMVEPVRGLDCTLVKISTVPARYAAEFDWNAPASGLVPTGYRWTLEIPLHETASGELGADATAVRLPNPTGLIDLGLLGTFRLVAVVEGWESSAVTGTVTYVAVLGIVSVSLCAAA